jgi:hypothetical protein
VAQEAVALAARTDALVDHGDACLSLATVLAAAGDTAGARAAAERAAGLYEQKGAAALAEKAHHVLGERDARPASPSAGAPTVEPENACVRMARSMDAAYDRQAWDEIEQLVAPVVSVQSRRKMVGTDRLEHQRDEWMREARNYRQTMAPVRHGHVVVAVRGERLALTHLEVGDADLSPGAPRDEFLQLYGLDTEGRFALQIWFDVEDLDAAIAEIDLLQAQFEQETGGRARRLENDATRVSEQINRLFADRRWAEISEVFAETPHVEERRRGVRRESDDRLTEIASLRAVADLGIVRITTTPLAVRGDRLFLGHITLERHDAFGAETIVVTEVD